MISKKAFTEIINGVQKYWDKIIEVENVSNIQMVDSFAMDIISTITDVLSEDMGDTYNKNIGTWLEYYAWELDFGRDEMAKECVEIDKQKYDLTTPEELYDILILLNKNENKG